MKLNEILVEHVVGMERVGDYKVKIDSHLYHERQIEREVDYKDILRTLRKLPQAKAKFKQLGDGQKFWLYDNEHNLALGISLNNIAQKYFKLKTVWPGMPTDGRYPVFNVA